MLLVPGGLDTPTMLCLLCNIPYVAAASKIGPARASHVGTGCQEKRDAMMAAPACGFLKGPCLCANSGEPSEGELGPAAGGGGGGLSESHEASSSGGAGRGSSEGSEGRGPPKQLRLD